MLYARRIKHKGLRLLYVDADRSKLHPDWVDKIERILAALNVACAPPELDTPGNAFHMLRQNRKGTYSVTVSGPHRITFKWDSEGPFDVDLENYHER
jgi:proteic killer suppression protein